MAYTEQQLSDIAGDEIVLSDKELELFSSYWLDKRLKSIDL